MSGQENARELAEARFAAKQLRHQEARRALSEYEEESRRVDQKTARLRALRLAKEAADREARAKTVPAARKTATARKHRDR